MPHAIFISTRRESRTTDSPSICSTFKSPIGSTTDTSDPLPAFPCHHEEALMQYDIALDLSQQAGVSGAELLGRTMIAKGIFLQHHDRAEEAKPLLADGIAALPATHSDAACGV
jgi:hypothetical protein